jgi:dimethylhistidine N-methyltransferase
MIARELVAIPSFAREVEEGLSRTPKSLPSKLFYDAPGSALFEEITRLPEYYLTRTELEILRERSNEIAQAAGVNISVVELGAGTATKTSTLLRALARKQIRTPYFPVDISPSALAKAKIQVKSQCPAAYVNPVVADFSEGFDFLENIRGRKLVLYLGSSIGNFDPEEAVALLAAVRKELKRGDSLLLGTDLAKDPAILIPAYDDATGITAEFNKNILQRLNRELGANFDMDAFRHIALWNATESRIEMHLESLHRQSVEFDLLQSRIDLATGERIHTENSYKYTLSRVRRMLGSAGFALNQSWLDDRKWFALNLARV